MDALTHSLVAAAVWQSRLSSREHGYTGALALLVAANAADAEGLLQLAGAAAYVRNHHGAVHSIAGAALIAVAVAGAAAIGLKRAGRAFRFSRLAAIAALGVGSHLILDVFHAYGEELLWPVLDGRFGLRLVSEFDVANLVALLAAMLFPAALNLVNAEIGAARVSYARGALIGLIAVAALLPVRWVLRLQADAEAASVLLEDAESYRLNPSPFLPWRWYLVQDTPISYMAQEVDALEGRALPGIVRFRKPIENNFLATARDSESGRAFLDLAAYPYFSIEEGRRGVLVRIRDMQFFIPGAGDRNYAVEIEVNSQGRVLSERANL